MEGFFRGHAVAVAGGAPAVGGVEGEMAGVEVFVGGIADVAGGGGGEDVKFVADEDARHAFADVEGGFEELGKVFGGGCDGDDEDVDVVLLEAFEAGEGGGGDDLFVDEEGIVAVFDRPLGDFGVVAFAAFDEGGEELEGGVFLEPGAEAFFHVGAGLAFYGLAAAVAGAELGVEEADEVPDFGDGGDGGFASALGDALFDGDGGWQAAEVIHVGFFELIGELAGVGGHGIEETALAFGEEDIEGEGGFA